MGKLAERFTDVNRSGVYRVGAPGIPRAAAMEAQARLVEMPAAALSQAAWAQLQGALDREDSRICVLLVSDAAVLGADSYQQTVAKLGALAGSWRAAGRSFFAVLVDPEEALALPPLYHEKSSA
jgi:hypothetical protein